MPSTSDIAGLAALAICESLLLSLYDRKILPSHEIMGILADAASAHTNAPAGPTHAVTHKAVAAMIQKIIDSDSTVRRN